MPLLTLIRDADKLDIWRVFVDYFRLPEAERPSAAALGFPDLPDCTPDVLATLQSRTMVNLDQLRTLNDFKLLQLSWVFDLNWPAASALALEQGHLNALAGLLPDIPKVRESVAMVMDHCREKAGKIGQAG